ncbi:hypothetical protein [Pengzhenrongella frigida]|uniref:Uncharacterized protein n=1 Tax=Pengzhenrongella frigida TaxID=1259133 RepID=A0A4Q5N2B3_9MICO|nr:hypothetical protein [Cellulomonas sp. HLT2-17]RYV51363.1 hypothetical protein EUA98_08740 [Cellulomonas sp. HLT2-17]
MTKIRSALWALLGTVLLALGAIPAARVPIIGDDFHAFFESYAIVDGNAGSAFAYGWNQGLLAGHFNPVGQAIGAVYHFGAFAVSSSLGISPQYYDVFFGSGLMWLTVAGAALTLTWGLRHAGAVGQVSYWRNFALLAAVVASTLQLHPWSNDPVTSFGPAGWGSAAIGFALLGMSLRSTVPGRTSVADFFLVGALAVVAVLYYEMLVGMIAGTAAVYVGVVVRARLRRNTADLRRGLLLGVVGVVLPAVIFVGGRFLAIPSTESNYTGTTLSVGSAAAATWWTAIVGALPGGGWRYLSEMAGSVELALKPVALALLLCLAVGLLVVAWMRAPRLWVPWTRAALIPVAGVVATWALTTATHTTTQKYIDEIKVPGQVYLYYVVGVVCAAILISWAIIALAPRAPSFAGPVALLLVGAFLMIQMPLNWRLATVSADAFALNRTLAGVVVTDEASEDERCAALAAWVTRPWPDYYREAVVGDAQEDFERVFGEPFCTDPVVLEQAATPAVVG